MVLGPAPHVSRGQEPADPLMLSDKQIRTRPSQSWLAGERGDRGFCENRPAIFRDGHASTR